MKTILIIIITLLIGYSIGYAQQKDDYKTMIDSAIVIKYTGFLSATKQRTDKEHLSNLYLIDEQDRAFTNLLSLKKFKSIDVYNVRNRKTISKGIHAWKVFTALNKNQFVVSIVDFTITYKKGNYNFANGGGSKAIFDYDCNDGMWKLRNFQNEGL